MNADERLAWVTAAFVTLRVTVMVCVKLPDTPVTLMLYVPVDAELLTAKLKVLLDVVLEGLNDAVTPLGTPEAERFTAELNPFWGFTVIVVEPFAPGLKLKLLGDADRVNPGVVIV